MGGFDTSIRIVHTFSVAFVLSAYPAWILYGDPAVLEMSNHHCTSPFYTDLDAARQGALGLFLSSIFVICLATLTSDLEHMASKRVRTCVLVAGMSGFIVSGLIAIEVVLSGSCDVDAAVVTSDIGNQDIQVVASVALILAGILGVIQFDFRVVDNEGTRRPTGPSVSSLWNLAVRLMLGVALVSLMSTIKEDEFRRKYIDEDRYNSAGCRLARSHFDSDASLYKDFYKPIAIVDLEDVNKNLTSADLGKLISAPPNPTIIGLVSAALGCGIIELFSVLAVIYSSRAHLFSIEVSAAIWLNKFLALFQFIVFGIVTASFLLSNEMVACPVFSLESMLIRWIFVSIALFYGFATAHVALFEAESVWTKAIVDEDNEGNSTEAHRTLLGDQLGPDFN